MSYEQPTVDEIVRDALAETMSEISESCWSAGWLNDLEYSLWKAMETGNLDYGWGIEQRDLDRLRHLAGLAGGWWIWPKHAENKTFVAMEKWMEILARKRDAVQNDAGPKPEMPETTD